MSSPKLSFPKLFLLKRFFQKTFAPAAFPSGGADGRSVLNSRLVRDTVLVIGGGVLIATVLLLAVLLPQKRESLEAVLEAEASGTAKLFASLTPPTPDFSAMANALVEPFLAETRIVGLTTSDGNGVRWLAVGHNPPDLAPLLKDIPPGKTHRAYVQDGAFMDFAWAATFNNDPNRHYVLAARMDASYVADELQEFTASAVAVTIAAAVLLTIGMIAFLNTRILTPVRNLSTRMQTAAHDPDHPERYREDAVHAGEIGDMTDSFNLMVGRIGETLSARQQAEAAAHADRDRAEKALSDLQRTQQTLIESEKMAALGGLVAGVAHEINTPVGNALGAISHLHRRSKQVADLFETGKLRKQDADEFIKLTLEAGDIALTNIQRASTLVHSFKQVAADHTADVQRRFRLNEYVEEVLVSLTPQTRRHRLTVECDIPADIELNSYPGALAQVLTNLVSNAGIHAFHDDWQGPRRVAITARVDDAAVLTLTVRDNGRGIPDDVLPHIFEPFFTTRRGAGGTGLGMHIVYNVVTQRLGGLIAVDSVTANSVAANSVAGQATAEQGTAFTIKLPVTAAVPVTPKGD